MKPVDATRCNITWCVTSQATILLLDLLGRNVHRRGSRWNANAHLERRDRWAARSTSLAMHALTVNVVRTVLGVAVWFALCAWAGGDVGYVGIVTSRLVGVVRIARIGRHSGRCGRWTARPEVAPNARTHLTSSTVPRLFALCIAIVCKHSRGGDDKAHRCREGIESHWNATNKR